MMRTPVSGLPVNQFSLEANRKIIWGLAVHLGYPEPQDVRKSLMCHVTNTGKRVDTSESTRGYETDDELNFQNDGGGAFMLFCLKTARQRGISKPMSVGTLFNAILAQRFDNVPLLSPLQREALNLFDKMCADPAMQLAFTMEPGDIQIGNNYAELHSRTSYQGHDDVSLRRHLLRVWFTLENGRPLPPVFAETREFGPSYARTLGTPFAATETLDS